MQIAYTMNSVRCGIQTTLFGNFRKSGTTFYPVRYKVVVMPEEKKKNANTVTANFFIVSFWLPSLFYIKFGKAAIMTNNIIT